MNQDEDNQTRLSPWIATIIMCVLSAIILIILYLQFFRYTLVGKSIDMGDSFSTALLLTPEITMGIATLL